MSMQMKVTLPNGAVVEAENGTTIDELREAITAAGRYNLTNATAIESTDDAGNRSVRFTEPQGTRKG